MHYSISYPFRAQKERPPHGGVLATVLGAFFCLWLFACQSPLQSTLKTSSVSQPLPSPELLEAKGFFVQAKVRGIDLHTGLVSLETTAGAFFVIADEDDLTILHEGDEITVYLVTDDAPITAI